MRILKTIFISALLFVTLAPSCKNNDETEKEFRIELLKEQAWYFSGEETSGDTIYYRPESYDFPMARGREGFQLKENGILTYYAISPTDFPMKFEDAQWSLNNENITISIPGNEYAKPRTIEIKILSLDEEKLKGIAIY